MNERRYGDDEVAAIFAKAADSGEISRRPAPSAGGMTLAELQEIGREVGLSADSVARAAADLTGQKAVPTSRRLLGLPIGVGRTVELGRTLSDAEWERLVVDLRDTFDARGKVSEHGSLRQWTNGNLQALLEPTDTGHRLRLKTMKGSSRGLMIGGIATLGVGVLSTAGSLGAGGGGTTLLVGLVLLGVGAIQIPAWASQRRRQMEGVIARLVQRTPPGPSEQIDDAAGAHP